MMKVRLAADIQTDSIVDGPGLRSVIWFQGCSHNCTGCHNTNTLPFEGGIEVLVTDVFKEIDLLNDQDGITLSGGDPFFQPNALLEIVKYIKAKEYNIWCYTGFVYEDILKMDEIYLEILTHIDVLVDGRFIIEEKSLDCKYRGSKNQRLIDVQKSLTNKKVTFHEVTA